MIKYLDLRLNLNNESHRPYIKPDSTLQYIDSQSNHKSNHEHSTNFKNHRKATVQSLYNETIFKKAKAPYKKALEDCGHKAILYFNPTTKEKIQTKQSRRNIIWFNPQFNKITSNIGKHFLDLMNKHFDKYHRL